MVHKGSRRRYQTNRSKLQYNKTDETDDNVLKNSMMNQSIIDKVMEDKTSCLISHGVYFTGPKPLYPTSLKPATSQISESLSYLATIGCTSINCYPHYVGKYCTIVLYKDPEATIVVDEAGNIVEGLTANTKREYFAELSKFMFEESNVQIKAFVLSGIMGPPSIIGSYPVDVNPLIKSKFVSYPLDQEKYLLYDLAGRGVIFSGENIRNSISFKDYQAGINDSYMRVVYEARHNLNVYYDVLTKDIQREFISNMETTYPYSFYGEDIHSTDVKRFTPYHHWYAIKRDDSISIVEGRSSLEEYMNKRMKIVNIKIEKQVTQEHGHAPSFKFSLDKPASDIYSSFKDILRSKTISSPISGIILSPDVECRNRVDISISNTSHLFFQKFFTHSNVLELNSKYSAYLKRRIEMMACIRKQQAQSYKPIAASKHDLTNNLNSYLHQLNKELTSF